jgi:ParB-like chromosome segregation protein Spo0J
MPVSDSYLRLPLGLIQIARAERQRKVVDREAPEWKHFVASIRRHGVLQPIIVEARRSEADRFPIEVEYWLRAGERRLEASRDAGLPDIPVRMSSELSPIESKIIEFEENLKRSDLPWQDMCLAVYDLHKLHLALDPEWTQAETADSLALSEGHVSLYIRVAGELGTEKIAQAGTPREAYNILARQDQRAAGEALQELLEDPKPAYVTDLVTADPEVTTAHIQALQGAGMGTTRTLISTPPRATVINESILHESFLQWASRYSGRPFNLIHCDFPYGIGVFQGDQFTQDYAGQYDDSQGIYQRLVECLCKETERLASLSAHLMFWCSSSVEIQYKTLQVFRDLAPSWVFHKHPLVWVKSDGAGIAADVKRLPRHIYETCLFASRGGRNIVRVVSDAYSAPTDKRLHPSCKPEPVLKHFMQMTVDEHTSLLDPTCGSASALRAAEGLGARSVLGMDSDEQTVGMARLALRNFRALRVASKTVDVK